MEISAVTLVGKLLLILKINDIKEIENKPIAKRGRIPGRQDNPRLDRII